MMRLIKVQRIPLISWLVVLTSRTLWTRETPGVAGFVFHQPYAVVRTGSKDFRRQFEQPSANAAPPSCPRIRRDLSLQRHARIHGRPASLSASSAPTESSDVSIENKSLAASVAQLKLVLEREYLSFFNPMEREYYAKAVTFNDPLVKLDGVDGYQRNVDMLAGRSFLGSILFSDASINLHSVTGGDIKTASDTSTLAIENITTRWTLRFTFKALPWRPTARFSGISVYTVIPGGPKGVQIVEQFDYWDSINLRPVVDIDGTKSSSSSSSSSSSAVTYQAVDRSVALSHFVDQIKPGNFAAIAAGPELPYATLRIGNGYEVRRYPAYAAVQMRYERRDEAFGAIGAFTSGMQPMAPAIMQVNADVKTMMWPLDYCPPGQTVPPTNDLALTRVQQEPYKGQFDLVNIPSAVVAVRIFGDALVEPNVRRVDNELRAVLRRDGLIPASTDGNNSPGQKNAIMFAQYDAVYSMGQRRSEVHIPLQDGGHPW